jgi:type IV secretion system pilin
MLYAATPLLGLALMPFAYVQADISPPPGLSQIPSPPIQDASGFAGLICGIVVWIFWLLIVLSVIMFLVGGYRYVTSGGDSEKVRSANRTLLYAAIAVVVALLAAGVPLIIDSFLGGSSSLGNVCSTFG